MGRGSGGGSRGGGKSGGGGGSGEEWTQAEKDAITTYTTREYASINSGLRSGHLSEKDQDTVDKLDSALGKKKLKKKAVLYENQQLYRAAAVPEINAALKNKKNIEGLVYTDKAFVSTTREKSAAHNFQRSKDSRIFVIHAPKGTRAADVSGLSSFGKGESETLLARNTKFKVRKVERVRERYKTTDLKGRAVTRTRTQEYIHVDVIGQG